jgi:hypothetical protein
MLFFYTTTTLLTTKIFHFITQDKHLTTTTHNSHYNIYQPFITESANMVTRRQKQITCSITKLHQIISLQTDVTRPRCPSLFSSTSIQQVTLHRQSTYFHSLHLKTTPPPPPTKTTC